MNITICPETFVPSQSSSSFGYFVFTGSCFSQMSTIFNWFLLNPLIKRRKFHWYKTVISLFSSMFWFVPCLMTWVLHKVTCFCTYMYLAIQITLLNRCFTKLRKDNVNTSQHKKRANIYAWRKAEASSVSCSKDQDYRIQWSGKINLTSKLEQIVNIDRTTDTGLGFSLTLLCPSALEVLEFLTVLENTI